MKSYKLQIIEHSESSAAFIKRISGYKTVEYVAGI